MIRLNLLYSLRKNCSYDYWYLHNIKRDIIAPWQELIDSDKNLFDSYRKVYFNLDDNKVDIKSLSEIYN